MLGDKYVKRNDVKRKGDKNLPAIRKKEVKKDPSSWGRKIVQFTAARSQSLYCITSLSWISKAERD